MKGLWSGAEDQDGDRKGEELRSHDWRKTNQGVSRTSLVAEDEHIRLRQKQWKARREHSTVLSKEDLAGGRCDNALGSFFRFISHHCSSLAPYFKSFPTFIW